MTDAGGPVGGRKRLARLALAAGALAAGWFVVQHARLYVQAMWAQSFVVEGVRHYTLADDAMISMRYANNLASGRGLVWNPGDRVLGVTNFGWTLVMAGVHRAGRPLSENSVWIQAANLVCQLGLFGYLLAALARRGQAAAGMLATALVAANGSLFNWGLAGFETSLQVLLCTLALLPWLPDADESAQARHFTAAMGWLGLAFVVRPDTLALLLIAAALGAWWWKRGRLDGRRLALGLAVGGACVVGVLAFQRGYYGAWLPNTFHLKATGGAAQYGRGLRYLATFCVGEFFQLPLVLGTALLVARALTLPARARAVPLALCSLGWFAYVVKVGGDAFAFGRFFIPVVPLLAAATAVALVSELRSWRGWRTPTVLRRLAVLVVAALTAVHVARFPAAARSATGRNGGNVDGVRLARALQRTNLGPDGLTAVFLAGVLPYFLEDWRFHDLLGKSDAHIARTKAYPGPPGHNKWDFPYSLGTLKPDLVVTAAPYTGATDVGMARQAAAGYDYGFHPTLWGEPTFKDSYRPHRLLLATDGEPIDAILWLYARGGTQAAALPRGVTASRARGLVAVDPRLEASAQVGEGLRRPAWRIERSPFGSFVWLASAEGGGLGFPIRSAAPLTIGVAFDACPGPESAFGGPVLDLTVASETGERRTQSYRVPVCAELTARVALAAGRNRIDWSVARGPSRAAARGQPAMVRVGHIRVGPGDAPPPRPVDRILERLARL
jgi:arabinofuranosyltransferase